MIQANLESCLEKNDFDLSANLLQRSKIICLKFNGHENLEMQINPVYERFKMLVISKLNKLSESCEQYFAQQYVTDDDLADINGCLQVLANAKHKHLLCEHIPNEVIEKHYETFLRKIIQLFENLNDEINNLFKNEKFNEMEGAWKQVQLLRRIGIVEQRTAEAYHSTTQSITGYMKSLGDDTEKLLNSINSDAVDYNKIFSNLKNLKDAEWMKKHKCGYYENIIKNIQNNLTDRAFDLYQTIVETNLDLDSYSELEKVDKILQQLDGLKKFQSSVSEIQKYCDQSYEYFNNSVENSLINIKNIFCLEKHSVNHLKMRAAKLLIIRNDYHMMQPNFLYLKSEQFSSIEKVEKNIMDLKHNIKEAVKSIEQCEQKQNWCAKINNEYSSSLKEFKGDNSKNILLLNNFKSVEDLISKERENKNKINELKNINEKSKHQIERLEMVKSQFNEISSTSLTSNEANEYISKTKHKNIETLNYKIKELEDGINDAEIIGTEFIFKNIDNKKAEIALNFLNSCLPIKFLNKKVASYKTEAEFFLCKYKEFITFEMNSCLNQIQSLTLANSFLAHGLAQRIKLRLEECVKIQSCTLLNGLMQSDYIKKDIVERLANYHMIIDHPGNNENLKTEIVKAFIQLDKFSENVKFYQLYCDYNKNKLKKLDDFEKNIMECIENYKFDEVAMKLFEIDEKLLKFNTIYKIKTNLANSINKIITETKHLLRGLGNTLDKNEVKETIKQLLRLDQAKKYLYNDSSLKEKYKLNSYIEEDTQLELAICLKFIHETISIKITKYINRIKLHINSNDFYEAEVKREHLYHIQNSLKNYYNSVEINEKIEAMQENLEERLNAITEKYLSMPINDYYQYKPKSIIDQLEKLVKHYSDEKYVESLTKINNIIKNQMLNVFQSVEKAKPDEREESMEIIKSVIVFLPDDIKHWVQSKQDQLKNFIDQENKQYQEEFNIIKTALDVTSIYNFLKKCKLNGMKLYIRSIEYTVVTQIREYCFYLRYYYLEENKVSKALWSFKRCLEFIQVFGKDVVEINSIFLLMESTLLNKFDKICMTFADILSNRDVEITLSCFHNLNYFIDLKRDIEASNHSKNPSMTNLNKLINAISIGLARSYENIVNFFHHYQSKYQSSLKELNVTKINESMNVCQKWDLLLKSAVRHFRLFKDNEIVKKKLANIEDCNHYDEIKDILSTKLKDYIHQIFNIELLKTYNNERDLFYKEFVKHISFVYHSNELKNHINYNIFEPNSYENEVFPFLKNYFQKLSESTKNIFTPEDTSDKTLQQFDLFRHNVENIKSFEMHSKSVGLNFNFSTIVQEITEKLYSTLSYLFTMVEKSEIDVTEKAKWLIKIKLFANNLPEYSEYINEKLDYIFKVYSNQCVKHRRIELAKLSIALEQDPSGVGFNIISEHSVFKGKVISIFNQNTRYHGIDYVLNKIQGDDINNESIQRLRELYDVYLKSYQKMVEKYIIQINGKNVLNEIIRCIKQSGEKMAEKWRKKWRKKKKWDEYDRKVSKLVASIFTLWTLQNAEYYIKMEGIDKQDSYLLTPHPSQVISVFRILGIGYTEPKQVKGVIEIVKSVYKKILVTNDKFQNNLVQIGTGEGKSLILAVASCVLSLIGFDVSCACYSESLSSRDYKSFLPLFISLDLTSHIRYATFNAICENVINQNFNIRNRVADLVSNKRAEMVLSHKKLTRPMILLIDEVDVFFNKDFYGNLYTPLARIKNPSIADLTKYIWCNRKEKLTLKHLQSTSEYRACCNYLKEWDFLVIEAVKDMLRDVQDFKHDYIIKNDKLAYKVQDGISYTRTEDYKTLFAYYFEHDEGRISSKSLNEFVSIIIGCGRFSFAEIPYYFHYITGVSGTLKTLSISEKKIVESYGIEKFTYIPSIFGENKRRFSKEANIFIENSDDYFAKLSEHIEYSRMTSKKCKRPVLVFFNTKASLMEFYNSNKLTLNKENIQIITEEVSESPKEKEMLIKRATISGQITFLTRAFGRGTDFVCNDKDVIANGGVHVVQTFFSEELSEEVQIQGRTAHQGKDGSYSMVLLDSDLEKYLGVDYGNKIEILSHDRTFYNILNLERNTLFDSTYLNIKKRVCEAKKEHDLGQSFVKNLNNNEIDEIKKFLGERNMGSSVGLNVSRTVCLMDATGSMGGLLSKAKATVGTMFERASSILFDYDIPPDSFQMQFAVYRDYDCRSDTLLQYSAWETKAANLIKFMDKISTGGGQGEKAVEVGLLHVNRENEKNNVNQVILIGDGPANPQTQIEYNRKIYHGEDYWKTTDYKVPTFYKFELEELKKKGIIVHAFYLHERAKSNFQEISSETGGECRLLQIDSSDGADVLTEIVTQQILSNVGQLRGKGNDLVKAYKARYKM